MRVKIALIVIITVIFSNIYFFAFNVNLLTEWKIYLPVVANLKYSETSEPSFPLGLDIYEIYEYKNPLKKNMIKCNEWREFNNDFDSEIINKATRILDYLEVPASKRPNFEKKFKYMFKQREYKELYLFYFEDDSVYVISRF